MERKEKWKGWGKYKARENIKEGKKWKGWGKYKGRKNIKEGKI